MNSCEDSTMEGGVQVLSTYMMVDAKAGKSGRHQLNRDVPILSSVVPAELYDLTNLPYD